MPFEIVAFWIRHQRCNLVLSFEKMKMRIAIATTSLIGITKQGEGVYLEQLLTGLQARDAHNEYYIFMPRKHRPLFPIWAKNFRVIEISDTYVKPFPSVFWYLFIYPFHLARHKIELVHLPEIRRIPILKICRTVLTVADLTNFRVKGRIGGFRLAYNWFVCRVLLRQADLICVHAENTKRDLETIWSIDPEKIKVIPHGIPSHFQPRDRSESFQRLKKYGVRTPCIVCVSRLEHPLKNHAVLLNAFAILKRKELPHMLILVGKRGKGYEKIEEEIKRLELEEDVRCVGFVPDEDLPYFYNIAEVSVFPSLYEGFGYPVLESFASGVPLIVSRSSSLVEVGGNACLFFEPHNAEELAEKILLVLREEKMRQQLIQAGFQRAAQYTLDEEINRTLYLYELLGNSLNGRKLGNPMEREQSLT